MIELTNDEAGVVLTLLHRVQLQAAEAKHFCVIVDKIEAQLTPQDTNDGNDLSPAD